MLAEQAGPGRRLDQWLIGTDADARHFGTNGDVGMAIGPYVGTGIGQTL
jgi:hypothetical protein